MGGFVGISKTLSARSSDRLGFLASHSCEVALHTSLLQQPWHEAQDNGSVVPAGFPAESRAAESNTPPHLVACISRSLEAAAGQIVGRHGVVSGAVPWAPLAQHYAAYSACKVALSGSTANAKDCMATTLMVPWTRLMRPLTVLNSTLARMLHYQEGGHDI